MTEPQQPSLTTRYLDARLTRTEQALWKRIAELEADNRRLSSRLANLEAESRRAAGGEDEG